MANNKIPPMKLPKLSGAGVKTGSNNFLVDSVNSNVLPDAILKNAKVLATVNGRLVSDLVGGMAKGFAIDQEIFEKHLIDLKTLLTSDGLKLSPNVFDPIVEQLKKLVADIEAFVINPQSPSNSDSGGKRPKNPKNPKNPEKPDEKGQRSLFSRFMSIFIRNDTKDKTKKRGDDDFIRKGSNLASFLLNPGEHFAVHLRKMIAGISLKFQAMIFGAVNAVIGGIVGSIGFLLSSVGGLVAKAMTGLVGFVGRALLGAFAKISPAGIVIGLGVAVYDAIQGWINTEGSLADKAIGALKKMFLEGNLFAMAGKWASFGAAIGAIGGPVGMLAGGIIGGVIGMVLSLIGPETIQGWISTAWEGLKNFGSSVGGIFSSLKNWLWDQGAALGTYFSDMFASMATYLSGKAGEFKDYVLGIITSKWEELKASIFTPLGEKVTDMVNKLVAFFQPVTDLFNSISDNLKAIPIDEVKQKVLSSVDWFTKTFDWISGAIQDWFDSIGRRIDNIRGYLPTWAGGLDNVDQSTANDLVRQRAFEANANSIKAKSILSPNSASALMDRMEAENNKQPSTIRTLAVKPEISQIDDQKSSEAAASSAATVMSTRVNNVSNTNVTNQTNSSITMPMNPVDNQSVKTKFGM